MCNNASFLGILSVVKRLVSLIQIIVPILLIVFASISFIKVIRNPEEKNGIKKIIYQFLAAGVVFFIPILFNILMGMLGEKTNFSGCWNSVSDRITLSNKYAEVEKEEKKTIIFDADDYEPGVPNNCPSSINKTRNTFNNIALKVDMSFYLEAHNHEFGNHYITQSGVYDCEHIIVGQNKQYKVNGVTYKSSGRIVWYDIITGERTASIDIGNEGGHLDRLAYDSDRDVVLLHLRNENILQIDNRTQKIIEEQKYTTLSGGDSKFIKYDSYNHQLIGLTGNTVSYYKYNSNNNIYVKTGSISLDATSKWAPQNINTDGQVLYIANSHPNWSVSDYAVIVYDMSTGKMLEYHKLDHVAAGHIEDVIVDTDGNLWLICPDKYLKVTNYTANSYSIGP